MDQPERTVPAKLLASRSACRTLSTDIGDLGKLLTISQAAKRLGVHASTVRRWIDDGRLPATRTVGGHRRIAEAEISRIKADSRHVDDRGAAPGSVTGSPADRAWGEHAVVQMRYELRTDEEQTWLSQLDEQSKQTSREVGHRLMGLLIRYVAGQVEEEELWPEVRSISRVYAAILRGAGLSLTAATRATHFFRDMLTQSTAFYPHLNEAGPEQQVFLMKKLSRFVNEIQLVITEEYERLSI